MTVIDIEQIRAVDLIDKGQVPCCQERSCRVIIRIVKKQIDLPRMFIVRLSDPSDHNLKDLSRKRVKKIETVFIPYLIGTGISADNADTLFILLRQFGPLEILNCRLTEFVVIVYA